MMAEQLRPLTALAERLGLVPSTHVRQLTITCNSGYRGSDALGPPWVPTLTWRL